MKDEKITLFDQVKDDTQPQNFKERVYEKIKIPVRILDVIIFVLIAAIVACVVIGALKGNGLM